MEQRVGRDTQQNVGRNTKQHTEQHTEQSSPEQKGKFAALAVWLFVGAYPLFFLHGYADVAEAKFLLMKGILILTAGGIFLIQITDFFLQKNKAQYLWEKGTAWVRPLSFTDKAVLGLYISFLISFILSADKKTAWTGQAANGCGMLYYQLCFLLYFMVSRFYEPETRAWKWWFISTILLTGYALIQFLGFDFLRLFPDGAEGIVTDFLSFLGNTGVFALYITLVLPAALYFCCMADRKNFSAGERVLCHSTLYLCCAGVLCANCDVAYLGFAAGYAGIAILTARDAAVARRFLLLTAGMCCCAKLTGLLFFLCEDTVRNVSRMTSFLLESPLLWFAAAGSLALAALVSTRTVKVYRCICVAVTVLSVSALGSSFLWFSVVDRSTPLGGLENYFRFSDNWGTERGYIYSRLLRVFGEENFFRKLFGRGPGMTFPVIQAHFREEMYECFEYVYDDAHSQWITLLITTGLSGCLWMLTALASGIFRALKRGGAPVLSVLLMVYVIVSTVSITQPVTGPFLWLGLGVAEASVRGSHKTSP